MTLKSITNCIGYEQITDVSASTALNVPLIDKNGLSCKPRMAIIIAESRSVRWRDDGIAPTALIGMPLATGVTFVYDGDLTRIRFIEQIGSAKLNVTYYA